MMQEEDYKLTPSGSLGGLTSVSTYKHLGTFQTTEEALEFVKQDMEDNQFFPNVWWVSDHGNYWLIDTNGDEIHLDPEERMTADVLVRRSNDEQETYWVDVQSPDGDILEDGGCITLPPDAALKHARNLQKHWQAKGYAVEIVFDGEVVT